MPQTTEVWYPVVRKWCNAPKKTAKPNDILLSVRAPVGTTNIADQKCAIGRGLAAISYEPCYRYILYYLRLIERKLDAQGTGTTFKAISGQILRSQNLPLAPLPEQRAIVAKLEQLFSELDNGIANLKDARKKLDIYRQAVLKKAFEGELTREWRQQQVNLPSADELLEQIKAERQRHYDQQLADWKLAVKIWETNGKPGKNPKKPRAVKATVQLDVTKMPVLPKGWTWANIHQLLFAPLCNGVSIKGSDSPPGIRALKLNAMLSKGFDYSEHRYLPLSDEKAQDILIQEGDFYVSRGNGSLHLVGRGVSAQPPPFPVIFPDTMIRMRLAGSITGSRWIEAIWPSRIVREQVEQSVKTTAGIYKISQSEIQQFHVPLPSLQEQTQIVQEIESRLSVCDKLAETIDTNLEKAETLRQSILKRAFEGKLLTDTELVSCRAEPDWQPAKELLSNAEGWD